MPISQTKTKLITLVNYLLVMILWFSACSAKAACSVTNGTINLGSYSSFSVFNTPITGSNTVGLSCTAMLGLGVLSNDRITATLQSSTNNLNLANTDGSGDKIPYTVYADSAYQYPFTIGQSVDYGSNGLLNVILSNKNFSLSLYLKTSTGANIRAGTYTDTLVVNWNYSICTGIGITPLLCAGRQQDNVNSNVFVTLIVTKQCAINNTPNANFGSYTFVGQFNTLTQNITLTCTKTEGYKISLSDGNNKVGSWRQMTDNLGNYLQYNLYQANGTTLLLPSLREIL